MFSDHHNIASDYKLWCERFGDAMTEQEFSAMSVEHKVRLLREVEAFGI